MMPSFFIAHGAPLLAIEHNEYTQFLNQLGQKLPRPRAIVLFSAHWEAKVQQVGNVDQYQTIYDFGGFDPELYTIQYPARGNDDIAKEIGDLFTNNGIFFENDTTRGLDHGAWVVLRMIYPNADIPIISMSVWNRSLTMIHLLLMHHLRYHLTEMSILFQSFMQWVQLINIQKLLYYIVVFDMETLVTAFGNLDNVMKYKNGECDHESKVNSK